jgi:hypothetical protein
MSLNHRKGAYLPVAIVVKIKITQFWNNNIAQQPSRTDGILITKVGVILDRMIKSAPDESGAFSASN